MSASTYVVVALVAMYVDAMATYACKEKYNWIASASLAAIWPVSIPAAIFEISALQNHGIDARPAEQTTQEAMLAIGLDTPNKSAPPETSTSEDSP